MFWVSSNLTLKNVVLRLQIFAIIHEVAVCRWHDTWLPLETAELLECLSHRIQFVRLPLVAVSLMSSFGNLWNFPVLCAREMCRGFCLFSKMPHELCYDTVFNHTYRIDRELEIFPPAIYWNICQALHMDVFWAGGRQSTFSSRQRIKPDDEISPWRLTVLKICAADYSRTFPCYPSSCLLVCEM